MRKSEMSPRMLSLTTAFLLVSVPAVTETAADELNSRRIELVSIDLHGTLGERFDGNIDYLMWRFQKEADHRLFPFEDREAWSPKRSTDWDGEYAGKWIDAAIVAASVSNSPKLTDAIHAFVGRMRATQTDDGYLGTQLQEDRLNGLFPLWVHWLAVKGMRSHGQQFTDEQSIDAAVRGADWLVDEFSPIIDSQNKLYQISTSTLSWLDEMASLYHVTGDRKYLDFAASAMAHNQAFAEMASTGRAPYVHGYNMMTYLGGAVMVAHARNDDEMLHWLTRVWEDIADRHLFPTASSTSGESWGMPPSDIPDGAMQETCATVEWLFFSQRLYEATGDVRYKNMIERTVRNALLGAQRIDGMGWTYHTPLRSRKRWLKGGTECCFFSGPRAVARLPLLVYSLRDHAIRVELFETSDAEFKVNGQSIKLAQHSDYPQIGKMSIKVACDKPVALDLQLRIPEHTENHRMTLNGTAQEDPIEPGKYFTINRTWNDGDVVDLEFTPQVWVDYLNDGSGVMIRGVEALSADQRDNDIALAALRIPKTPEVVSVDPSKDGRPLYRATLEQAGKPLSILLTPFAAAGNPTSDDAESASSYRTAFPAREGRIGKAVFSGARSDVEARVGGPGVSYRENGFTITPWDLEGGHGYLQAVVGGGPLRNHGTVEIHLAKPMQEGTYGGIRYAIYGEYNYGSTIGIFLGHKDIKVARWPDPSEGGKTPPRWKDTFPLDQPGRTGLRIEFTEERMSIAYHDGERWVKATSCDLRDVRGEDWTDPIKYTAFPVLLGLGGPVHYDCVTWEGPYLYTVNPTGDCFQSNE